MVKITIMGLCVSTNLLLAQAPQNGQPITRQPSRPTISPYLNLARGNSGALPSYQAFVVPQLLQNQQIVSQWRLQTQAKKIEQTLIGDPNMRQTGLGGKFDNRLHFYPTVNSPRSSN